MVKTIDNENVCSISTPFLDRHNDHLDIYLLKDNGNILLTDNGYTIADLRMSGMEINTPKRENILKTALNGFGVKVNDKDELYIIANSNNIGQKKHYLLQAMLTVNDMFNLSQETVTSLFKEDVELYFRSKDIFFSKDIKLTGKSGFDHNIDFLIPQTRTKPERLIKTVNSPKKNNILNAIMAFNDVSQSRDTKTANYVIYNDIEKEVSNDVIIALENYNVKHIPWSHKEDNISEFSLN
ncbi:DUF1828 domain-containing protein [Gramella jeungdoensis]|uniref:DUF1828 domain-containing protein n=1 Tax=Gramella jeungdoensis TaxID=708091 RepID=A0ABT0YYT3_9FLAO|nr:DUF1828 domain-containing protein [Gramella jeungdoensis]MCM8568625.1 DUF1828 domain-containing protein [Gramella jeungdoensis]